LVFLVSVTNIQLATWCAIRSSHANVRHV